MEKFVISGGPGFITAGAEFSLGRKDKSPSIRRHATYFESLSGLSSSYLVLYDTLDHRAWLSNGLHTLVHLLRASLKEDLKGDFSDECLLNYEELEDDLGDVTRPETTVKFLKNRRNLEQPLFPGLDEIRTEHTTAADGETTTMQHRTSTTTRLKDRVNQIMDVLWQLIDHQATLDILTSAVPIRLPRSKLEGYRFMDVATRRAVTPRAVYLRAFDGAGKSWVDFVRAIRAVTLFGENFGDLIQPHSGSSGPDMCSRWMMVPKGRDYLVVSGYDLARILRQEGSAASSPIKLAPGIFWTPSDSAFKSCNCDDRGDNEVGTQTLVQQAAAFLRRPCDRVQVLLPKQFAFPPRGASATVPLIGPSCALIYGRSGLFPWRWPEQGEPEREEHINIKAGAREADEGPFCTTGNLSTQVGTDNSTSGWSTAGGSSLTTTTPAVTVSSPPSSQSGTGVISGQESGQGEQRSVNNGLRKIFRSLRKR